jgi:hypothetical protein
VDIASGFIHSKRVQLCAAFNCDAVTVLQVLLQLCFNLCLRVQDSCRHHVLAWCWGCCCICWLLQVHGSKDGTTVSQTHTPHRSAMLQPLLVWDEAIQSVQASAPYDEGL